MISGGIRRLITKLDIMCTYLYQFPKKLCLRTITTLTLLLVTSRGSDADESCAARPSARMSGDVIIGGLFDVHEPGTEGQQCSGRVNPDSIQRLEAFLWAVHTLNKKNFTPGVRYGALAFDTCGQVVGSTNRALDYLSERQLNQYGEPCDNTALFLGIVGDYHSDCTEAVASLLSPSRVTQISYASTSTKLSDKQIYPYLLRTVPSSAFYVEALLDVIKEVGWYDVILVVEEAADAQDRKEELLRTAGVRNICIVQILTVNQAVQNITPQLVSLMEYQQKGASGVVLLVSSKTAERFFQMIQAYQITMPALGHLQWIMGLPFQDSRRFIQLQDAIKGLIALVEYSGPVPEFQEYFVNIQAIRHRVNPWFRAYWEQTHNCTVGVTCGMAQRDLHARAFKQANYVAQTISAVYTYAHALKLGHLELCHNVSGICEALSRISAERLMAYLGGVSFVSADEQVVSFDDEANLDNPTYTVQNIQLDGVSYSVREVGRWTQREGLRMHTKFKMYNTDGNILPSYPPSKCHQKCECRNVFNDYSFGTTEEGDFLIHGVFDMHGAGHGAQECGEAIQPNSVQALEAMYYAVDLINKNPNILPGIKMSVVSTDSCRDPNRAVKQVTSLMTGKLEIMSRNEEPLPLSTVLGAASSDVSMALASYLTSHKTPQVSYASSTSVLGDKSTYPYFLRTIGSDNHQVQAVIDVIKKFNWTYVKLFFSNNEYGRSASNKFLQMADISNICVATQVRLESYLTNDRIAMRNIIRYYIIEAFTDAKVVVMFTTDTHTRSVLEAMDSLKEIGGSDVIWIASDFWGTRRSVVKDYESSAAGALTLDFLTDYIPGFMDYFKNLLATSNTRNPWFDEYWQEHFKCYTSNEFSRLYDKPCDPLFSLLTETVTMATHVPYVIDAVYTIALSLHKLVEDNCEKNTTGICQKAEENIQDLYQHMKGLKFYNGITNLTVSYDAHGNGIPRYRIMNYQKDLAGNYDYYKVGSWEQGVLDLDKSKVEGYLDVNKTAVKTSSVMSYCRLKSCLCSSVAVSDLQYELKYARLTLLGYFPLHQTDVDGAPCRNFRRKDGFEPLMAFKYAIDRINKDPHLLPNVSLGYMVFDTCSTPQHATMTFNALDKNLRFFAQAPQLPVITYVHAFIGGMENDVTMALNEASDKGQGLVQISPGSTGDRLINEDNLFYFLRTIAPESNQARALVAVIRAMSWTYISIFHSNGARELDLVDKLESIIDERGLCIATKQRVGRWSTNVTEYSRALTEMADQQGAIAVLVVATPPEIRMLLRTANNMNMIGKFIWIGTDQWGDNLDIIRGLEEVARGAVTLVPDTGLDPYFDSYMRRIRPNERSDNPWIKEFWQDYFQCDLIYGAGYNRVCDGSESLTAATFSTNSLAINTINAVYAYAYGLTKIFMERCGGMVMPPCRAITGETKTSTLVYDAIKHARFTGADGRPFSFTDSGNGVGRYRVMNLKVTRRSASSSRAKTPAGNRHRNRNVDEERAAFLQVGEWASGELSFNKSLVYMYDPSGNRVLPQSHCTGTCNCSEEQLYLDKENVPLKMKTHNTVWGILIITISLLGITLAFVTIIFFIMEFQHPVVVGSTSSLSLLLLLGILLLYLSNIAFMLTDTWATCGVRRFSFSTFHCILYSVLLVKVVRITRICKQAAMSLKPAFVGGLSQLWIAGILIFFQVVMSTEWLLIQPPDVRWELFNIADDRLFPIYTIRWRCMHSRSSMLASMWYVFLLITVSLAISIKSHRATNYQYEALCILVSTSGSTVVMVIWACVYTLTDDVFTQPACCIAITTNTSLVFASIFLPKILVLTSPKRREDVYSSEYAVPKRIDERNNHGHPKPPLAPPLLPPNAPPFTIPDHHRTCTSSSSTSSYDPYQGIDMASFERYLQMKLATAEELNSLPRPKKSQRSQ